MQLAKKQSKLKNKKKLKKERDIITLNLGDEHLKLIPIQKAPTDATETIIQALMNPIKSLRTD